MYARESEEVGSASSPPWFTLLVEGESHFMSEASALIATALTAGALAGLQARSAAASSTGGGSAGVDGLSPASTARGTSSSSGSSNATTPSTTGALARWRLLDPAREAAACSQALAIACSRSLCAGGGNSAPGALNGTGTGTSTGSQAAEPSLAASGAGAGDSTTAEATPVTGQSAAAGKDWLLGHGDSIRFPAPFAQISDALAGLLPSPLELCAILSQSAHNQVKLCSVSLNEVLEKALHADVQRTAAPIGASSSPCRDSWALSRGLAVGGARAAAAAAAVVTTASKEPHAIPAVLSARTRASLASEYDSIEGLDDTMPVQRGNILRSTRIACESAWAALTATGLRVPRSLKARFDSVAAEGAGIEAAVELLDPFVHGLDWDLCLDSADSLEALCLPDPGTPADDEDSLATVSASHLRSRGTGLAGKRLLHNGINHVPAGIRVAVLVRAATACLGCTLEGVDLTCIVGGSNRPRTTSQDASVAYELFRAAGIGHAEHWH